jgi:WD40 repeat protein
VNELRTRWLGYDVFISYTHRDAKGYAEALQRRLGEEEGLVCFRDATELVAGDMLDERIQRALAKSRMLVALGTPGAKDSDYMVKEIKAFDSKRPMIGVSFEGSMPLDLWPTLRERIRLEESLGALGLGRPSDATIEGIQNAVRFLRRRTLAWIMISLFVALIVLLAGGVMLGLWTARAERIEQDRQRQIAIARRLAQEAERHEGTLAILLAAQAWRFNEGAQGPAGRDIYEALRDALARGQIGKELALPEGVVGEPVYLDPTGDWARLQGEDGLHTLRREGRRMTLIDEEQADAIGRPTSEAVIRWSADGRIVREVLEDGTKQVADISGAGEITSATVSVDGSTAVVTASDGGVHLVRFGPTPDVTHIYTFETFESEILLPEEVYIDVAVARSGNRIAVAELIDWDRLKVIVWEVSQETGIGDPWVLHDDFVEASGEIYLDPRGQYLVLTNVAIEGPGSASVWNLQKPADGPRIVPARGESFQTIAFSRDGEWLAMGTGRYGVDGIPMQTGVEVVNLEVLFGLEGADQAISRLPAEIDSIDVLRFSDDGERLLSTDGSAVRVFHRVGAEFQPERVWRHDGDVFSAAWIEDGGAVLSVTRDGGFWQWDLEPPSAQPRDLGALFDLESFSVSSIAIAPDGRKVVVGGDGGVEIWDLDAADQAKTSTDQPGYVTVLDFERTGAWLVGGDEDGALLAWRSGALAAPAVVGQHPDRVTVLVVLPNSDYVLSGGLDGSVRIWPLDGSGEGRLVDDVGREIASVAAQADGTMIAWSFGKTVRLGPWEEGEPEVPVEELSYGANVTALAFGRDALLVALGDGSVLREPLADQGTRTSLGRHPVPIGAAAVDPQGRWLATGDTSGEVRLWDLVNGGPPAVLAETDRRPVTDLEFGPDGNWLIFSSEMGFDEFDNEYEGEVWLRYVTSGLLNFAEENVWRNLSCDEWMEYVGSETPYRRTFDSAPLPHDFSRCADSD